MNSDPTSASRNRPNKNGPSMRANTVPMRTGVTEAVNEKGREASSHTRHRLGRSSAVSTFPCVIAHVLRRYYEPSDGFDKHSAPLPPVPETGKTLARRNSHAD